MYTRVESEKPTVRRSACVESEMQARIKKGQRFEPLVDITGGLGGRKPLSLRCTFDKHELMFIKTQMAHG